MYNKFYLFLKIIIFVALIILIPQNIFAAQLIFKEFSNNNIERGQEVIIEVLINPQLKSLNVIEGTINLKGSVIDTISVGVDNTESVLTIWPTPPEFIFSEKNIRFTGGVPNGFNRESLLFKIRIFSSLPGSIIVSWMDGSAYLNDGLGTKENIFANPINIKFGRQYPEVSWYYWIKNIIILLIVIFVFFIFFILIYLYGYKKNIKK